MRATHCSACESKGTAWKGSFSENGPLPALEMVQERVKHVS